MIFNNFTHSVIKNGIWKNNIQLIETNKIKKPLFLSRDNIKDMDVNIAQKYITKTAEAYVILWNMSPPFYFFNFLIF